MKLISLSEYVTQESKKPLRKGFKNHVGDAFGFYNRITKYNNFLKQPLTLGMFFPADEEGNVYVDYHSYQPKSGTVCEPYQGLFEVSRRGKDVELLNEPQFWKEDQRYYNKRKYDEASQKYQEAKQRVLFEGFDFQYRADLEEWSILSRNDFSINYDDKYKTFEINRFYLQKVEDLLDKNIEITESAKQKLGL